MPFRTLKWRLQSRQRYDMGLRDLTTAVLVDPQSGQHRSSGQRFASNHFSEDSSSGKSRNNWTIVSPSLWLFPGALLLFRSLIMVRIIPETYDTFWLVWYIIPQISHYQTLGDMITVRAGSAVCTYSSDIHTVYRTHYTTSKPALYYMSLRCRIVDVALCINP